jgi:hypothetical protein
MLIKRRPPWWQHRDVPCPAPDDVWRMDNLYSRWGDGLLCYQRSLCQKWGNYDDLIDSEHARFTADEALDILDVRWLEIVVLDEMIALRARVVDAMSCYSQSRRAGIDMIGVYLQVFRADPLRSLGDLHA